VHEREGGGAREVFIYVVYLFIFIINILLFFVL
jgi:hypothetical protein